MMLLRPAEPSDSLAVAEIHVRSWQVAYRGLLPGDYLDALIPQERECDLTRARLIGVVMRDAVIDGLVTNLVVNGVEVSSYVEAELDRRHPVRLLIRSADPAELLRGFRELQAAWSATLERLRGMPGGSEHQRVGGEWSAVETGTWCLCATAGSVVAAWGRPARSPPSGWFPATCLSTSRPWTRQQPRASTRCWLCATCKMPSWTAGYRP